MASVRVINHVKQLKIPKCKKHERLVNKQYGWQTYRLDQQENVTRRGNCR